MVSSSLGCSEVCICTVWEVKVKSNKWSIRRVKGITIKMALCITRCTATTSTCWFIYKILSGTNWTIMAPSTTEPNELKLLFLLSLPLALLSMSAGVLLLLLLHMFIWCTVQHLIAHKLPTIIPLVRGKTLDWWNLSSYHAKPLPVKYSPSIWECINFL